jgi:DNA-binding transcriptional LysR family regulator
MLDDVALFIHIARSRGLSSAAAKLNLPAATVTRRLRKLEEEVGAQLVFRSARKFALTTEGEAYYEAFADLVTQFETARQGLRSDLHELRGRLKVAAPTNISVGLLEPMWSGFLNEFPEIQLTLNLSNENKDLLETQIDLALRVGPQTDMRLYQKRLGCVATMLVASPEYLAAAGDLNDPEDLRQHKLIWVSALPVWQLSNLDTGQQETLHLSANVAVDDIGLARQLARDGHGIALLPVSEFWENFETGQLHSVLPRWQGQKRDVYAVWPTGRLLNARAKCLRDYVQEYLAERPVFQGALPHL